MFVYLAGPVEVEDTWREKTAEKLKKLRELGLKIEPLDPIRTEQIKRSRGITTDIPPHAVVAMNLHDLNRTRLSGGFVLMNLNTTKEGRRPLGTLFEFQWANDHEVPVIAVVGRDAHPDIRNHPFVIRNAAYVATSLTDALNFIEAHFAN